MHIRLLRERVNVLSRQPPYLLPSSPTRGEEGDKGGGERVTIVWNAIVELYQPSRFLIILLEMIVYECARQWWFHAPQTRASGPRSQASTRVGFY